jgi:beta-lactamase regulating signal transducer with metallopeptidase domain
MISEILAQHTWLWPLAWQSTTILALGLGTSFLLRRRAVRAHQLLLLALVAAVAVPALSHLVKQHQWGLLRAQPKATAIDARPIFAIESQSNSERAAAPRTMSAMTATTQGPATTRTSSVMPIGWKQLVVPLWIVLSAALLVRLTIRFLLGYGLARQSAPCDAQEIASAIESAKVKLGMNSDVRVRRSADTHSPVIWCWGSQPLLLVPAETETSDNIDWESVICHELAHWKRRDHLGSLWAELMLCLLPWNPLSWWAQHRLVRLSEEACDDWVIASGQIGTRYARTLLGLTPQGRAALVSAVVSSKKGLATRVRRILADQCTSPRSGRRWSLAAAALVACLAVGIAFAQAKPTEPTGMTTTTLAHGAVIEQLASTGTIKGIVLDPNGQPTPERTTGITVLPLTCHSVRADEEGQFEIQWSPSWTDPGQPVYLVARNGDNHLARIVAITDPTAPVIINLTPALTVSGRVFDSSGQPIDKATAALSLPVKFECRAPIASADTGTQGAFAIGNVPNNQTYTLKVRAKGYQGRQITVTVTDQDADEMNLGSITLQPKNPAQPAIADRDPNPNWKEAFDKIHRLNDGEIAKLIKVPFSLVRQDRIIDMMLYSGHSADMLDYAHLYTQYRWDGNLEDGWWHGIDSGHVRLSLIVHLFLDIPSYEFDLPEELGDIYLAQGDWIVRKGATTEEKLQAIKDILYAERQKSIHLEKRQVECDTIVVTGRYAFTPLPDKDPNRLCIIATEDDGLHHNEADSLPELFDSLADYIEVAIDNRTEPIEAAPIPYSLDYSLRFKSIDREKDLPVLLDNLARQTGLTFKVEKRPADVWFITEEKEETALAAEQP